MWRKFSQLFGVSIVVLTACVYPSPPAVAQETLELELRNRPVGKEDGSFLVELQTEKWRPTETAIIVCDMWDLHHCYRAVLREKQFAPRLNKMLEKLRDMGVTIIHAPSGCMETYASSPARLRAIQAPASKYHPEDIDKWCSNIPAEDEGTYPIDQSDGGEDDEPQEHAKWAAKLVGLGKNPDQPWSMQIDLISIDQSSDFISDSGREIWNVLQARGVKNVMLAGVHTNMCVLGRPFGLRQMAKNDVNVVLVRDLTDTMYNPAAWPYVNHFTGTDLIVEHIERFVCPTITSDQILGGQPFRFEGDQRPTIALMVGEREYETSKSLDNFAVSSLGKDYRVAKITPSNTDRNRFPNIGALTSADVLLLSVRRRTLPSEQLKLVKNFVAAGKPVIAIRTSSHAFSLRNSEPESGYADWPEFDKQVLGGNYTNHYGSSLACQVTFLDDQHPLLRDFQLKPFQAGGSLYRVSPLAKEASVLAMGRVPGETPEPVAWVFQRDDGGKSFYTSLGHTKDFEVASFTKILRRAVDWALRPLHQRLH